MPLQGIPRLRGVIRAGEELYPLVYNPAGRLLPVSSNFGNNQGRGGGRGTTRGKKNPGDPVWPYGTDALWDNVVYMHDFSATDFYPDGTGLITDQAAGIVSVASPTISGGKLVKATNSYDNLGTPAGPWHNVNTDKWCLEAWVAFDQGDPGINQNMFYLWSSAPNNFFIWRKGNNGQPTFSTHYITSDGTTQSNWNNSDSLVAWATTLTHYCFIFNGGASAQWKSYVNGVLVKNQTSFSASGVVTVPMIIQAKGSYQSIRFTKGTSRYNVAGFTPDTNFGKGLPA